MDLTSAETRVNGSSCNCRRNLSTSSLWAIQAAPASFCFKFQCLQKHQQKSLSSLVHLSSEYEQQNLFNLKERAFTTIGLEVTRESDGSRRGGEAFSSGHSSLGRSYAALSYEGMDKMLIAASTSETTECHPAKEFPPSENSGTSTPRQRRKRRSAAERRESHRRRSSAVVHDAVHLAKILNGSQQKQKHHNGIAEERCAVHPFSPIPDHSETENDACCLNEPPEPSVHAPGDEDEQEAIADRLAIDAELLVEQLFGGREEATDSTADNLAADCLSQNSFEHRRSISADHLLHGIGLRRERQINALESGDRLSDFQLAEAIQIEVRNSSPHNSDSNNAKVGQEMEEGQKQRTQVGTHSGHNSSKLAHNQSPFVTRLPVPLSLCSSSLWTSKVRCASSAVKANEDPNEGISVAEATDSFSGPEQSFQIGTARWEKEMNRSSELHDQQQQQEWKKKANCKRRNSSVSTVSAPCAHSIPTSSNVFLHLVDRFVSKRQYSDSNLLKSNVNKPIFGANFGRRSFKWNLFWGRKDGNNGKCMEKGFADDRNSPRRWSGEDEEGTRDCRRKDIQRKKSSRRLGTLMEDTEIAAAAGEDRERKKRQPHFGEEPPQVAVDMEKRRFANTKSLPVHSEEDGNFHPNEHSQQQAVVRKRTNSSLGEEDKRMDSPQAKAKGGGSDAAQRFSLIGSSDLAKLEEIVEMGMPAVVSGNGVRRAASLQDKYRVREEDSLKLDIFLKERRLRMAPDGEDEEGESDQNSDEQLDLEQFKIHCSRPIIDLSFANESEHSQKAPQRHLLPNDLKKVISPQLNTSTTATLTMPRKKNHNLPRKSSICFHNIGTLKRKKGVGKSQLARRRSSYVTKAQVLMAKSKIQKEEELRKNKAKGECEDEARGEKSETEDGDKVKEKTTTNAAGTVTLREGAKLLAKQRGASVSSSSLRQLLVGSERKASRGSKVAPKANGTIAEKERAEKDKKRESKANSALLGTIWSIRPRRKKESNRSLANLFTVQNDQQKMGKEQRANDNAGPPDALSSDSPKKFTLAQSPSSTAFSFDQIPDLVSVLSPAIFTRSQLNNARWDDLNIWEEEQLSWAAKFPTESLKLENSERKRQNIIHELMMTEKNHCQVLVLLRQVYQEGLLRNGILDKATVSKLIPDVLDTLLDFHLNLLRRFRTRGIEGPIVHDISDIICQGFGDNPTRYAVIQSYTTFCLAREYSHSLFAALIAQKTIVRKFFEFHESEHKERSFKDCMLLIAQRLTKYPILIEQILKYESSTDQKLKMQKAHFAVKSFALEINDALLRYERKIQWEAVKKALEKGSTGKLIDPKAKQDFTYADLVDPVEETFSSDNQWGRTVCLVQRVFWRETMTSPDVELRLLLCDDIIVFLRPKGASIGSSGTAGGMGGVGMERKELPLQFFRHNCHSGVLPLYNTLVKGENLRRKSLLLIVTDKEQPDLIQLSFPTSPEMEQCVHAIKQAKTNAPKFVRLSKHRILELSQRSIGESTSAVEKEYQTKMDTWQRELERIFMAYSEDSLLVNYFECRMTFFDSVRAHLCRCPLRHFSSGEEHQQKRNMEREKERLSALLNAKLVELSRKRNGALAHLVERAQRARDADVPSFFDDLHDLGAAGSTPSQSSSSSQSDEQFNQTIGSSDSCENQMKMAQGAGKKKPRRVRTYHGHGSAEQKSLSGSSGSSAGGGIHPIRRHTTVPAGGHHLASSDEEDEEADSETRRLPLKMNPMSRKAATEIIRDNVRLRCLNDRLKKESALKDLQLVSLRSRRGPSGETPERLECLRQKQEELQAEKKEFLTECRRKEEQFGAKCAGKEESLRRLEGELKQRADEFARMKEELETLRQKQTAPKCHQKPDNSARTPPKGTPNNAAMGVGRISNTYCGAGPIPRPTTGQGQRQNEHFDGADCSSRLQTPQLVERRAISQMELPRHLAVKTETKQADKVRKIRKN